MSQPPKQQPSLRFDPVFKVWYDPTKTTPGVIKRVFDMFDSPQPEIVRRK